MTSAYNVSVQVKNKTTSFTMRGINLQTTVDRVKDNYPDADYIHVSEAVYVPKYL